MGLDGFAKQQAQNHRRQKTNQDVEGKALRIPVCRQRQHRGADFFPIDQDHRKDGAGLDRNLKHLAFVIRKAQQGARQNQMPGGGDGQKLGDPFDHTHDRPVDQYRHIIHTQSFEVPGDYSCRSAAIGSICDARRAG